MLITFFQMGKQRNDLPKHTRLVRARIQDLNSQMPKLKLLPLNSKSGQLVGQGRPAACFYRLSCFSVQVVSVAALGRQWQSLVVPRDHMDPKA